MSTNSQQVQYGQNYYLYCLGVSCSLSCPTLINPTCLGWLSGKYFNPVAPFFENVPVSTVSTLEDALPIQFMTNDTTVQFVQYLAPIGISTQNTSNTIPDGSIDNQKSIAPAYGILECV